MREKMSRDEMADLMGVSIDMLRPDDLTDCEDGSGIADELDDAAIPKAARPADFYHHLPTNSYLYVKTGDACASGSIAARFGRKEAVRIAVQQGVEQTTWFPGEPQIIRDKLMIEGGWSPTPKARVFNLYRAPAITDGDPTKAEPWLDHMRRVFPDDWQHLKMWFAWRVQRPDVKVNHALVMGGDTRTGKDTCLVPVREAIGPWNFSECSPDELFDNFNAPFLQRVILRINEARDLGDSKMDRYSFYERMKAIIAAPPETILVNEKHLKRYTIPNLVCPIITTNNKFNGLYLPADDSRHYVAWSPLTRASYGSEADYSEYFGKLYGWFNEGGNAHVAAYLRSLDLSSFDPKAPPPRTPAFYDIVSANRPNEDNDLDDVLRMLCPSGLPPDVVTVEQIRAEVDRHPARFPDLSDWLCGGKSVAKQIPVRLDRAGYTVVRNPFQNSDGRGRWKIGGRNVVVYGRKNLSAAELHRAARRMAQ
jgi:hypothetical protein